jgi:hypothetical protein
LFVVGNDELLRADVLEKVKLTTDNNKNLLPYSFQKNYSEQSIFLENIKTFVQENKPEAIVLFDIEIIINKDEKNNLLAQINFAREALLEFNIPIIFWIKNSSVALFANFETALLRLFSCCNMPCLKFSKTF